AVVDDDLSVLDSDSLHNPVTGGQCVPDSECVERALIKCQRKVLALTNRTTEVHGNGVCIDSAVLRMRHRIFDDIPLDMKLADDAACRPRLRCFRLAVKLLAGN